MRTRLRNDLSLYDRRAGDWWDEKSRFAASLHGVNELRLRHIFRRLGGCAGKRIIDLGCGGGLIAEPLARAGAQVIGMDISGQSVQVAAAHGAGVPGLCYLRADIADVSLPDACADAVIMADVIEHVDDWRAAVTAAGRLLRPGGACYVNTINRTWRARLMAVTVAEGLGFVPRGTHDADKFVRPLELMKAAEAAGLHVERFLGQRLLWMSSIREYRVRVAEGDGTGVGYSAWLCKNA